MIIFFIFFNFFNFFNFFFIFFILNVIVSGLVDYMIGGRGVFISIGLPQPIRWHGLSAILLLIDVVIHVSRRAKRLRHSTVR